MSPQDVAAAERPRHGRDEICFQHSIFCQVGMPRSRFAGREFTRRSGRAWMVIQAGYVDDGTGRVARAVPHGVMPRLLLAWICNEIKRTNGRSLELDLGSSPRDLLRQLGLEGQGARYRALHDALHDLAAARFQLGFQARTLNTTPVQKLHTWGATGGARLLVSQDFAVDLMSHAVPLEQRALAELSGSALALDLYTWFAHRLRRLERRLELSWNDLHRQLGQEYQGARGVDDFRKKARVALDAALQVYPAARVRVGSAGLDLFPSDAPVRE